MSKPVHDMLAIVGKDCADVIEPGASLVRVALLD
jgi:hypothetical protein